MRKAQPRESEIQNAILEWLQYQPGFYWRQNNTPRFDKQRGLFYRLPKFTPRGVPDIIGCRNGLFVAIEVKRPGGKPSPAQKAFQAMVEAAGGIYIVATSIEDIERRFNELGRIQTVGPTGQ